MSGARLFTQTGDPLAIGPLGGCAFCAYELQDTRSRDVSLVPAVTTIDTPKGQRAVCAAHALAGTWRGAP